MKQLSLIRKCWHCGRLKIVGIRCDCFPDKKTAQKNSYNKYRKTKKGKEALHRIYINQKLRGKK